jgi:hypothetical protein
MPFPCRVNSHIPCRSHAVPMPFTCRGNTHMLCRDPAIPRQSRVLRESPRCRRKYPNYYPATGNSLLETPLGSRKKPNAGRSPICRLWTADANSHIPCRSHAVPMSFPCSSHAALCRGLERLLSERHGHDIAGERTGVCEWNMAALCKLNGEDIKNV